jgi:hypothetical protein
MPKPRDEMLHMLGKLIDEYAAFQRSRPDNPKATCGVFPKMSWSSLSQLFNSEQTDEAQRERALRLH